MSRLDTMARFEEEEIHEPKVMEVCENCGAELHEGEEVVKYDGGYYCDTFCLLYHLDHEHIYLGE